MSTLATKLKQMALNKKNIPMFLLICVSVVAFGLVVFQRGKIQTFLGGLPVPDPEQGATLLLHSSVADSEVSQSRDVDVKVSYRVQTTTKVSAIDAIVHFDPIYFEVKEEPRVVSIFSDSLRTKYDNAAGTLEIVLGQNYPGKSIVASGESTLATFTLTPKKIGQTSLYFDYGSQRNSGLSHFVITDNNGTPVDILDHANGFSTSIVSPVPVINSDEQYTGLVPRHIIKSTSTTDVTPVILNGRGFDGSTKFVFGCASGVKSLEPSGISADGKSVWIYLPSNTSQVETKLGTACFGTSGLSSTIKIGVQTQFGTAWYAKQSGTQVPLMYDSPSSTFDPVITSSSPSVVLPGSQINIQGKNFQFLTGVMPYVVQLINKNNIVKLENIVITPPNSKLTTNQLTATVPTSTPIGLYDLEVVQTLDGQSRIPDKNVVLANAVTVGGVPQILSVLPSELGTDYTKGTIFQIEGTDLGVDKTRVAAELKGSVNVTLDIDKLVTNETAVYSTLSATLPSVLPQGTYDLVVTVDGISQTRHAAFSSTAAISPNIVSIDPDALEVGYASDTKLTVDGDNLQLGSTVAFKGNNQTYPTSYSIDYATRNNGIVKVVVPDNLPVGSYALSWTLANAQSTEYPNALTVTAPIPVPSISGVSPDNLTNGYSGTPSVVVSGSDFGTSPVVTLVGSQTYSLTNTQVTDTQITGTIPNGMAIGKYKISVTSKGKTGNMDNAFEVKDKPAPTITSVTPSTLEITYPDNTPVTIIGTNFRSNSKVKLIGPAEYELRNPTVNAEFTQIQAQLPSGIQPGTYKIAVYSDGGPIATAEIVFIVTQTPQKVMAPIVTNLSDPKWSTKLSASWTLPIGSSAPQYYQYRILDNGNEIRAWDYDKIQLATSVTAKGLTLMNGHIYTLQVRGVNSAGPGDITTSTTVTTRSANLDYDPNEKVGLNDLQLLGRSMGRKDKPMGDINQNGIVSIDDLGILLTLWNP
jgi:methionine-rich copper-binding protein CopC